MSKEKLYQTNIYALLNGIVSTIEEVEKKSFKNKGNLKEIKLMGVADGLNAAWVAIHKLQEKTFNGNEFTKDEIKQLLNENL